LEKLTPAQLRDASSLWEYPELADRLDRDPHVKGAVIYQVLDMTSSQLGAMKAIVYGWDLQHGLTCTTPEEVVAKYPKLDVELVSTTKWPAAFIEKEPPIERNDSPATA
jgi:hypothetical protein